MFIKGLMKIGDEKWMNKLFAEGNIYGKTAKWYRANAKNSQRKDSREGAFRTELIENPENVTLKHNGQKLPVELNYVRVNKFNNKQDFYNLYCMFGLKDHHVTEKPFIKGANVEFGGKAVIIEDTEEFISRVSKKLDEEGYRYEAGYVNYYEEKKVNKGLTFFDKPDVFKHQSEFRFVIESHEPTVLNINIGSIEDIAIMIDSEKLPELRLKELNN